ncbi:MAG: hypothetical protein JW904_05220 [Spirochaetales bacterium]|nr:hypothetical protein [Spirochaetales bacterium]
MANKLVFLAHNRWSGGGIIPPELRNIDDLGGWMNKAIQHFKLIGKNYTQYLTTDNELIGQEKANLILLLENLLGGIFVFRDYLAKYTNEGEEPVNVLANAACVVRLDTKTWEGKGVLPLLKQPLPKTFADWYNTVLMPGMKNIFVRYAEAAKDTVLTPDEREKNILGLEQLAADILQCINVISSQDISF